MAPTLPRPNALRHIPTLLLLTALGLVSTSTFALNTRQPEPTSHFGNRVASYVPGQVLVTFKHKASARSSHYTAQAMGDNIHHVMAHHPDTALVKLGQGETVSQAVRNYKNNPGVVQAQPNYIYHETAVTPDDPGFDRVWGLHNTGQTIKGIVGKPGSDIDAPKAWEYRTDCSNIPIAVVDSGVNYEQADLTKNMWDGAPHHGHDFVDGDDDPLPSGGDEHGTHVAGIIAAVGNNHTAISGVCWKARIMSVRVLGADGSGTSAQISEGIHYAVDHGARIINMSLGGTLPRGGDPLDKKALQYAQSKGVIVVTSAGNDGEDNDAGMEADYPCSYDLGNLICVAALNQKYQLAYFSNYGKTSVDVGAPGVNILSTMPGPIIPEDFQSWILPGATWKVQQCGSPPEPQLLTVPKNWCNPSSTYAPNLDAVAYHTVDLTGSDVLGAGYSIELNMNLGAQDSLTVGHKMGNALGNPFAGGIEDEQLTQGDNTEDHFELNEGGLPGCAGEHCSVGFRFQSDASGQGHGIAVRGFDIRTTIKGANETALLSGTSMAAPYVAGVTALAWSIVPHKNYKAIRKAVLNSGDLVGSLASKTATGRAVNAFQALQAANDPPSLHLSPSSIETTVGHPVTVSVEASDPDTGLPQKLAYSISQKPNHGRVSFGTNHKTLTYTPDAGYTGHDSFGVTVDDGFTGSTTVVPHVSAPQPGGHGGGGCVMFHENQPFDPSFPLLLLGALVHLGLRRRKITSL